MDSPHPATISTTPPAYLSWRYALITWTLRERGQHQGTDPYKPAFSFWPTREAAQQASALLPEHVLAWSVVDINVPRVEVFTSAQLDKLILAMRRNGQLDHDSPHNPNRDETGRYTYASR